MNRSRLLFRLALGTFVTLAIVVGVFVWGAIRFYMHVPEAYAAWDSGEWLIEYMKSHDDRWPTSWQEFERWAHSLPRSPNQRLGDPASLQRIGELIRIDYSFDPANPGRKRPVRPLDGDTFPYVWAGTEPNEMIEEYLRGRAATRPSAP